MQTTPEGLPVICDTIESLLIWKGKIQDCLDKEIANGRANYYYANHLREDLLLIEQDIAKLS